FVILNNFDEPFARPDVDLRQPVDDAAADYHGLPMEKLIVFFGNTQFQNLPNLLRVVAFSGRDGDAPDPRNAAILLLGSRLQVADHRGQDFRWLLRIVADKPGAFVSRSRIIEDGAGNVVDGLWLLWRGGGEFELRLRCAFFHEDDPAQIAQRPLRLAFR